MKTQLTNEQSEHLMSLGVPEEKASIKQDMYGPALFTLTDLLEILPKEIEYKGKVYMIETFWNKLVQGWCTWYRTAEMTPLCLNQDIANNPTFIETELIDALYELCVWCLKNNHLKF